MTLPAGLHYDIPASVYHADPAPEPSLSQSMAKILLTRSPAHARLAHPRLNPAWIADNDTKFDVGNIAHRLILGRGREIEKLPKEFGDWRTKDARAARDAASENGKLAVLAKDHDRAAEMIQAAFRQLIERGYGDEWSGDAVNPARVGEVVAIARVGTDYYDKRKPTQLMIYLRAMIDWLPSLTRVWDYKSTGMSANPDARGAGAAVSQSLPDWCIQAAMHERILNILDPENAGRREHRFVVQEDETPYALVVVRLTEAHLTVGRAQIARAESIWAKCMATGEWPAYPLSDASPEYPAWKLAQVMEGERD